jgi:hypothetical protein
MFAVINQHFGLLSTFLITCAFGADRIEHASQLSREESENGFISSYLVQKDFFDLDWAKRTCANLVEKRGSNDLGKIYLVTEVVQLPDRYVDPHLGFSEWQSIRRNTAMSTTMAAECLKIFDRTTLLFRAGSVIRKLEMRAGTESWTEVSDSNDIEIVDLVLGRFPPTPQEIKHVAAFYFKTANGLDLESCRKLMSSLVRKSRVPVSALVLRADTWFFSPGGGFPRNYIFDTTYPTSVQQFKQAWEVQCLNRHAGITCARIVK